MTILEEARHSLILIEHDPLLYEHAVEMTEYVSKSMSDAAKEAAVLLYSPGTDTFCPTWGSRCKEIQTSPGRSPASRSTVAIREGLKVRKE